MRVLQLSVGKEWCGLFLVFLQIGSAESRRVTAHALASSTQYKSSPLLPALLKDMRILGESKFPSFFYLVLIKGIRR